MTLELRQLHDAAHLLEAALINEGLERQRRGLEPVPDWASEWPFHPTRRWRLDLAWPDELVAVEVDGGTYTKGRHTRGSGVLRDCQKVSTAAAMGWRVLRVTPAMVASGEAVRLIVQALEWRKP